MTPIWPYYQNLPISQVLFYDTIPTEEIKKVFMDILFEKIVHTLKDYKEILAVYVYGSFAKGHPSPKSDMDIAVFPHHKASLLLNIISE